MLVVGWGGKGCSWGAAALAPRSPPRSSFVVGKCWRLRVLRGALPAPLLPGWFWSDSLGLGIAGWGGGALDLG